jgi:hypothetical protein
MFGRQGRHKRRDPSCGVRAAGVTAFIIPTPVVSRDRREGRLAKPTRGKGGRELDARSSARCNRCNTLPILPSGLKRKRTPRRGNSRGSKRRSGLTAWCRRWVTASKAASKPPSQGSGCSRRTRLANDRDIPDGETNDWRAVCGKTARTVRREGRRKPSLPLSNPST